MNTALLVIDWLCSVVILAEGLNKLERMRTSDPCSGARQCASQGLKAGAWALLVFGAGGAFARPLLGLDGPTPTEVLVLFGFATLIVRTRVKEG